jgi:putative ABC transport system permease protein
MIGYIFKTWKTYPLGEALNIVGIGLAVAVYISIQCVNESADRAFSASVEVVTGKADAEIVKRVGILPEDNFLKVIQHPDIKAATPILEKTATLIDKPGEYLRVIGVDFFSNAEFSTFATDKITQEDEKTGVEFLTIPEAIGISDRLARRLNLKKGDEIKLQTSTGVKKAKVVGIFELREEYIGADEHIALMDIAHAQEFFNHVGELSRIDLIRHEGVSMDTLKAALQPYLSSGAFIQEPKRRSERLVNMTEAFRLNLVALSLVALLVSVFLIYNTTTANVARRYHDIGIWRALGATRAQIRRLFILEAIALAILGSAFGLPLGYFLAQTLVEQASQTISALYVMVSIQKVFFPIEQAGVAVALAMAAAIFGAWIPAKKASEIDPAKALQPANIHLSASQHIPTWSALGILFLGMGVECARQSDRFGPQWLSFGTALFLLLSVAFLCPIVFWTSVKIAKIIPGTFWRLAMSQFEMAFTRNVILSASIICAVAMVVGILIMITSFRSTVNQWLQQTVKADIFIAPLSSVGAGAQEVLPKNLIDKVKGFIPETHLDTYREITIEYQGTPVRLASIQFNVAAEHGGIRFMEEKSRRVARPALLKQSAEKEWIIVSESFSRRYDVRPRHRIRLMTDSGEKTFRVAGVFQDYTTESGLILIDSKTYQKYWNDKQINSLAIYASKDQPTESLKNSIKEAIKEYGAFMLYSNRDLRRQVLQIFDQTFAITSLLQSVTMLICAIGIYLNIIVHGMERSRIMAALRAQGVSQWQLQRVYGWEALFLGSIAVGMGIAAGYALSWVLANVINVAFFGWTIAMNIPKKEIVLLGTAALFILIAAAWLASWRLGKQSIAMAIKTD